MKPSRSAVRFGHSALKSNLGSVGARWFDVGIMGLMAWLISFACAGTSALNTQATDEIEELPMPRANVTEVTASGSAGDYRFNVTILSPDTGCDQYADWWEVVSSEGELLYRRVLLHSHVDEQPFTRSGGPVSISPDQRVVVRAHMSTSGYGGSAYVGTVSAGFGPENVESGFAIDLEAQSPLPTDCGF